MIVKNTPIMSLACSITWEAFCFDYPYAAVHDLNSQVLYNKGHTYIQSPTPVFVSVFRHSADPKHGSGYNKPRNRGTSARERQTLFLCSPHGYTHYRMCSSGARSSLFRVVLYTYIADYFPDRVIAFVECIRDSITTGMDLAFTCWRGSNGNDGDSTGN